MATIEISKKLKEDILKKFKSESKKIFSQMYSLQENPKKGKLIGSVGGIVIKELKCEVFRFYFITNGYKLRIFDGEDLSNLLIRFVRMSNKKNQQKTINEIKNILLKISAEGFND